MEGRDLVIFGATYIENKLWTKEMSEDVAAELDARGLLCPLPVLKLRKRMEPLAKGQSIRITADDPAAVLDIPHFSNEQGHSILESHIEGELCVFVIKKGGSV